MCAISLGLHSFDAVVDAVAHIDVKTPWLTKERFVAGGAAAVAVAGSQLAQAQRPPLDCRRRG